MDKKFVAGVLLALTFTRFNMTRRYKLHATSDSQMSSAAPSICLSLLRVRF